MFDCGWHDNTYPGKRVSKTAVPFLAGKNIRACCFSHFSLTINGKSVNLHSLKADELIALLICERGKPISKQRAAGALWPNNDCPLPNLYKVIEHIHRWRFEGVSVPLIAARGSICIDISEVDADTEDFIRLYNSDAPEDWVTAVELYRGILLIDSKYDWAVEYEAYYDVRYYELLERLTGHYEKIADRNMTQYYRAKQAE
ncbi:MAG: hypothetical protein LBD85_01465 [Oscillospiraceae bacterium]|nr:hypothetical protein [Oscillospiraceae bacterium]